MSNLLADPLIRVARHGYSAKAVSLPELFAALVRDEISHYPALRPHQDAPWHMFLAQLGALAMLRAGREDLPKDAQGWQQMIRDLTPGYDNDEPWQLVVEDRGKPAFMQPPEPEGGAKYTGRVETPDGLDMLVTSKNHDLKQAIGQNAGLDDWIFALVTLQTANGNKSSKYKGIARMNKGSSSRASLGLVPLFGDKVITVSPGKRLVWDIRKLLRDRAKQLKDHDYIGYSENDGLALLWTIPWPDDEKLQLGGLDIWFIEVCRRFRFSNSDRKVIVETRTNLSSRIEAETVKGVTGDPWAPIDIRESKPKSLSLGVRDFSYSLMHEILFTPEWNLSPILKLSKQEVKSAENWLFIAQAMGRGQDVTYGYRERRLILPRKFASILSSRDGRAQIGQISKKQIDEIKKFKSALGVSIAGFVEGGSGEKASKEDFALAHAYQDRLDKAADELFFPALWKRYEASQIKDDDRRAEDVARLQFLKSLLTASEGLLDEALKSLPCPAIYRHRAHVRATTKFHDMIRSEKSVFSVLRDFQNKIEDQQDDAA